MKFTPRINEAIKLASRLHRNQTRKDAEKTPYISHLVSVAIVLSEITDDEDIIIAGLMHDSMEDVEGYAYEHLVSDCGERVANIVKGVTETKEFSHSEDRELRWLKTKELYLENLKLGSIESAMVSAADKIHNTESFLIDAEKEGEQFIKRFGASMKNKLLFNEKSLGVITNKLGKNHALVMRLASHTEKFKFLFSKYEK